MSRAGGRGSTLCLRPLKAQLCLFHPVTVESIAQHLFPQSFITSSAPSPTLSLVPHWENVLEAKDSVGHHSQDSSPLTGLSPRATVASAVGSAGLQWLFWGSLLWDPPFPGGRSPVFIPYCEVYSVCIWVTPSITLFLN
jgi:hypothetical protein